MIADGNIVSAIDLASREAGFCLCQKTPMGWTFLAEKSLGSAQNVSERFIDQFQKSLAEISLPLSNVTHWITSGGPGGFTGLRIAASTLKGFAFAHPAPAIIVNSAEIRALDWVAQNDVEDDTPMAVLTRAGRVKYVRSLFKKEGQQIKLIKESSCEIKNLKENTDPQTQFIVDSTFEADHLPDTKTTLVELNSRMMVKNLKLSQQSIELDTIKSMIEYSPNYYGTPYRTVEEQRAFRAAKEKLKH